MKVGFTGSRRGMSDVQKCIFEGLIPKADAFLHGSCQGSDVEAARIVRKLFVDHIRIVCLPGPDDDPHREDSGVDDEVRPPKNHFARNRDIVKECDLLIACPCDMQRQTKGGTYYTIAYAEKVGKKVWIIWPDGRIE